MTRAGADRFDAASTRAPAATRGDAYRWRQVATVLGFAAFGTSGLLFGFVFAPWIRWRHRDATTRGRAMRTTLRRVMQANVAIMRGLRMIELRTEGVAPRAPGAMVIANHPSLIDAVLLLAALDEAHCIAKRALLDNPFIGRAVRGLDYPDNASAPEMVGRCVALLATGHTLLVFPEGTRTPIGRHLGPLHRGAAHVAVRSGCPIHPVTIQVSAPTLAKGMPWWHVPARRPRFVVRFHPPQPGWVAVPGISDGAAARALSRRWETFFSEDIGRADPT